MTRSFIDSGLGRTADGVTVSVFAMLTRAANFVSIKTSVC